MKKYLLLLIALWLCLSCGLTSCSEQSLSSEEGAAVLRAVDQMKEQDSYTETAEISYRYDAANLFCSVTRTETVSGLSKGDYRHRLETQVDFKSRDAYEWYTEDYTLIEGYENGKLYLTTLGMDSYDSISAEDYRTYLEETRPFDLWRHLDACNVRKIETVEGKQTITFREFPKQAVYEFANAIAPYVPPKAEIFYPADLLLVFTLDRDGCFEKISLTAMMKVDDLSNEDTLPTVSIDVAYSNIGKTQVEAYAGDYGAECKDLSAIRRVATLLETLQWNESLKFTRDSQHSFTSVSANQKQTLGGSNSVEGEFSLVDGKLSFAWTQTSPLVDYQYKYADQLLTVNQTNNNNGKTEESETSLSTVRALSQLESQILPGNFSYYLNLIRSVSSETTVEGDTLYTFVYNDADFSIFGNEKIPEYETKQETTTFKVWVNDGKVIRYRYRIDRSLNYKDEKFTWTGYFDTKFEY